MPRRYIFADESGNFDFSKGRGASRYFILTTITANDCSAGQALLELRRELAWQGIGLGTEFHATTDTQEVRNRVFVALKDKDFRVDATIMEKSKAQPAIRTTDEQFYKMAWHLHMKDLASHLVEDRDELLVVGASVGTKKRRTAFHTAIVDVMKKPHPQRPFGSHAGTRPAIPACKLRTIVPGLFSENGRAKTYGVMYQLQTKFDPNSRLFEQSLRSITDMQCG